MLKRFYPFALAAALGLSAFASAGSASATAIPAAPQTGVVTGDNGLLQDVNWSYDRNRHGDRYHSRHGAYRYYHGGYYYNRPWWSLGLPTFGIVIYRDNSWCSRHHYRRNYSWMSNGHRYRCR